MQFIPRAGAGLIPLLMLLGAPLCSGQKHREAGMVFRDWYVVKPLAPGAGSVAYGSIRNEGHGNQVLSKADFSCAKEAALHETLTDGGRARMVDLGQITIAPDESVVFEPGRKHIMLQELTVPPGEKCTVSITLSGNSIRFEIPVRDRRP